MPSGQKISLCLCGTARNGSTHCAAKIEKQSAERTALRQKITDMAKEHGFDIHTSSAAAAESRAAKSR
jgi:galactitol-specific phosphotransferase system IIB component